MSRQDILKQRLRQSQDFDTTIRQRTFGMKKEDEDIPVSAGQITELSTVRKIKERINQAFGERILTESKNENFRVLMRDTIADILNNDTEFQGDLAKKKTLTQKIMDDILGFGPIQDLIEDDSVTEVMVTRWDKIYAEKNGKLQLIPDMRFNNEDHLRNVIDKIVQPIGRRVDESEPLVDARLPDGSRVNATVPPVSPDGSLLTIRKFSKSKLTGEDYLRFGSLDEKMLKFLELCVLSRCNIIVSGGTGTGKTTLLNMLSNFIPAYESIVTIEDSCELMLGQDNVRRLESRAANVEGTGEVSIRRLVKNSLRMRPDRIIVGEIRDGGVVDMFRAMSSGHDGSLTTLHANSPKDLIEATLPILFGMSEMEFSETAIRQQIVSAIDVIVQISRIRDGSRKITNITHIVGLGRDGASKLKIKEVEAEKIYLQDVFRFKQIGMQNDRIQGVYETMGYIPKSIINRLESSGITVPSDLFNASGGL